MQLEWWFLLRKGLSTQMRIQGNDTDRSVNEKLFFIRRKVNGSRIAIMISSSITAFTLVVRVLSYYVFVNGDAFATQ